MVRFLWKALRHSVRLHLLIPLALFVLSEFLFAKYIEATPITREWVTRAFLPRLGVVYATFIAVVAFVVNEEGRAKVKDIGALTDALRHATHYFAVSTTSMREWFEPSVQVYLARVVSVRTRDAEFVYQRVQLFLSDADMNDIQATYLDRYQAECFVNWHTYLEVPVRFLRPHEIRPILDRLTADEKRRLDYHPWPIKRFGLWRLKRSGTLAFALVWNADAGTGGVVRFHKSAHELEITYHVDDHALALYRELAVAIHDEAAKGGHDFVDHLLGVAGPQKWSEVPPA
jgi:hypothetical protein